MSKERCECGKIAIWCYMPGYSSGNSPYHCDDCVPRGCECNYEYCKMDSYHPPLTSYNFPTGVENVDWIWIEKDVIWSPIDIKQREFPCAEYMYDVEGFERQLNPHEL